MKVGELRTLLKDKDQKLMNDAFVEVYKLLPKNKKEEADVMIASILSGQGKAVKKVETMDMDSLLNEMRDFMQCAYEGLYIQPNRIIPKSERSKWRFKVKSYLKVLFDLKINDPYFKMGVLYLEEFYKMLSYGCGVYIFSADDPFRSVGIAQEQLLENIAERKRYLELDDKDIEKMIQMACISYLSSECLHVMLVGVLWSFFADSKYRQSFVDIGKAMIEKYEGELQKLKKYDSRFIGLSGDISELNELVFVFSQEMNKQDMDYYYRHSHHNDNEIALFCLLKLIEIFGDKEKWIEAYEYALKKKIKPRDTLINKYKKIRTV